MKWVGASLMVVALAGGAGAGEILFANGSRVEGELANEMLMVSTGSGLLEVSPEQVTVLTRDEIRLTDGRVIRGTLVGEHVKARTALGELAIKRDEFRAFRAGSNIPPAAGPAPAAPGETGASLQVAPGLEQAPRLTTPSGSATAAPTTVGSGLPAASLYQGTPAPPQAAPAPASAEPLRGEASAPGPTVAVLAPSGSPAIAPQGRRLEVITGESALYRDAFATAARVGRVVQGEHVIYLDSIDRRLRILNALIFDGGHWIKVRATDGTVGWVPADSLREVP